MFNYLLFNILLNILQLINYKTILNYKRGIIALLIKMSFITFIKCLQRYIKINK